MKKNILLIGIMSLFFNSVIANTEITITGNDSMMFDVKQFSATAGTDFKLTFKNVGNLPKIAMGHNLVVLKKGVTAIAFGQKVLAVGGSATNPLPNSVKSDVLVATKLLGPGETEELNFKIPLETGSYEYVCTFPGHFAMMRGVMEVK
jgi:azurin